MDSSESEDLLFGEDSEDEFVLPTDQQESSESDEEFLHVPRKKKQLARKKKYKGVDLRKNLFPSQLLIAEDENMVAEEEPSAEIDEGRRQQNEVTTPVVNENDGPFDQGENNEEHTPKKKPRKIVSDPSKWKCNLRKNNHQAGKEYMNKRGKKVAAKTVKNFKDCLTNCKFKCSSHISNRERTELFTSYYSLTASEKRHFLMATSERGLTCRPKRNNVEKASRRMYSFKYFFTVNGEKIQVCKSFYLGTLNISQKPIYNVHSGKNFETNTPPPDKRGKSQSSRRTPAGDVNSAIEHINSFPRVESHYCRAQTKREYLGPELSILKMYDLYVETCREKMVNPVKQSMYRNIFLTKFNLGFHQPKSDRCDVCEKYKVIKKTGTMTESDTLEYDLHISNKNDMREESRKDKLSETPVLVFDLENVITCPRAAISSFFYTRKLNVYNLTAHFSTSNQIYCAIWNETMAGRQGNDIASAVRKILDVVKEENNFSSLVTWSDSCVPQNRNSIMSCAVIDFLRENSQVKSVTMKYSVPGHSCCQMVDNAHSQIERSMDKSEFYSPIGLVRVLIGANRKKPFRVIQMKNSDFKNFAAVAKTFNYKSLPFFKVSTLKFTQTYHEVEYKTSHNPFEPMNLANLRAKEKKSERVAGEKTPLASPANYYQKPKMDTKKIEVSELKKKDIKTMFPFMPTQDREYFKAIFKIK